LPGPLAFEWDSRKAALNLAKHLVSFEEAVTAFGKYAARYAKGSIVVTLAPDVAAVFPGAREANDALRILARAIRRRRGRRSSRRSA
jgi:uncharacterized DUF497 family protein